MSELIPCPFCGSKSIDPQGWKSTDSSGPVCDGCGASAESVERWNARAESLAVSAAVMRERERIATLLRERSAGFIFSGRMACSNLADEIVRPSPALDVLAVVQKYIQTRDGRNAAYKGLVSLLALKQWDDQMRDADAALRSLVDGAPKAEATDDDKWDQINEEEYQAHVDEAKDGGAEQ